MTMAGGSRTMARSIPAGGRLIVETKSCPMKVTTMRRVDRWAGVVIASALTVVRRIADLLPRKRIEGLQRILFVKLAEQGSTVLAYPALQRAVEMVGRGNVYFLAFEENRFILDALDIIPPENVIPLRTTSLRAVLLSSLGAVRRMRSLKIDAAVDMEFFARSSAIFSYRSGAARRVGFHSYRGEGPYRGGLMTHPLVYNPHLHTSQVFHLLVEALNHPPELLPACGMKAPPVVSLIAPVFNPGQEEVEEVAGMLRALTGLSAIPPLILLNANSSDLLPLRRWEEGKYVALARRLLARYPDVVVAFTGWYVLRGLFPG